jgi:hypothetical protein
MGRVKKQIRTQGSTGYTSEFWYDLMGNLNQLSYPSTCGTRRKVQYAFNGNGELDKLSDITTTAFDYVTGTTYSPLGTMATMTLKNQVVTTVGWDKRGLNSSILTEKPSVTTFLNLGYDYYDNGQFGRSNGIRTNLT